ncbi:MAG: choline dehydrogenase [bacterium]|nr:choline dehydrogenase [bacterium]
MTPDYIIVGAGSAGGALAARLSEDPGTRVLLLEAGGRARHWSIDMPLGYYLNWTGGPYNWAWWSEPQDNMAGRRIFQPRGKGLGGSSAINGMAFLRGHPMDFDRWEDEGATGWSFRNVLPFFKRLETHAGGETEFRGGSGPVRTGPLSFRLPMSDAFVEAGLEAGFRLSDDFNGENQEGMGWFDASIANGKRVSSASAYLEPTRQRPNLDVRTHAEVVGIEIYEDRATGVRIRRGRDVEVVHCAREIILSAGPFGSPHILMLSGVGPASHLRDVGIVVRHDLPGVGQNLQEHVELHIPFEGPVRHSLNRYAGRLSRTLAGARWFLNRSGICATNGAFTGAFTKTRDSVPHPDIQYHFFPFFLRDHDIPSDTGGFTMCVGTLRERSRGEVRLRSADPAIRPAVDFRFLSEPSDLDDLRICVRQAGDIALQPALAPFRTREENTWASARSDADIDDMIRHKAETGYHPCSTCRMGTDDLAVVDPECRVRGLSGLRVVDSSIFPSITSGNLNAPSIMVGERAADLIEAGSSNQRTASETSPR